MHKTHHFCYGVLGIGTLVPLLVAAQPIAFGFHVVGWHPLLLQPDGRVGENVVDSASPILHDKKSKGGFDPAMASKNR